MKILVKFPTRGRPDLFFKTLDLYYKFAIDKSNLFFLVSLDEDDSQMMSVESLDKLNQCDNLQVVFGKSNSKIDAVNRDMDKLEFDYDIILLASDDMIPQVEAYDLIIKEKMIKHYPDTDGILFFDDGYRGNKLNTLSIFGKKYYERFNYIYYPGYISVFADNEFMDVGNLLNRQTYIDECIIKHEHPANGAEMTLDEIHFANAKNHLIDEKLFLERKRRNFDL
jgi:hypothetical protein